MFIRKLKSRNGNIQVQVAEAEKVSRNNRVVKHLGTARNDLEVKQLIALAQQFIDDARIKSGRISFFDTRYTQSELESFLSRLVALGVYDDEDDLRKFGYSKDHRQDQPQLVIALTVNTQGIPLQVKVFAGNKFEGHTMIPCVQEIVRKHNLKDFVVVADSAMVSQKNMDELEKTGIKYIVGARLGNLPQKMFNQIVENVPKTDGSISRLILITDGRW